ncbi:hypothetical protein BDZ89DRAFT_1059195 [Hymenopellis radicata]|nr:hypothetical protein BDZ89DRAFT_1059195 [Hymenopellis radicata]
MRSFFVSPPHVELTSTKGPVATDEEKGREVTDVVAEVTDVVDPPPGVLKFLAMRKVMSKRGLWMLWIGLGIMYFTFEFDNVCVWQYLPYATSSFGHHSLLSAVTVAGSTISSVGKPVFSKLADTLGRGESFILCVIFYELGYLLMSQSPTLGVYAGGYVFYCLGQSGTQILSVILIADVTSVKWRSFATSAVFISYIVCVWISSETVSSMLLHSTWRWGVRMMIFIMPVGTAWIVTTIFTGEHKAHKAGILPRRKLDLKTAHTTVIKFFSDIDLGGIFFLSGGCAFILVALSLAATVPHGWKNGGIIASLILGPIFLIILPIYEKKVAKHPLIPNLFWKNRVVMLAVVATFFDAFGAAISSTYMYSWMVVTQAWTIKDLTYFNYAEWQVSTLCGIVAGLYMLRFKRYKYLLVFGSAVRVLAFGLQLQYRQPQQARGLLVMVRVLQGLGSGFAGQILGAVCQFEVLHEHLASVIAFQLLWSFVASAIGDAVAGAMWTNLLPSLLRKHLPTTPQATIDQIFGDITNLPAFGTVVRDGMVAAYMDIMRRLTIVSLAISIIPFLMVLILKNKALTDAHSLAVINPGATDERDLGVPALPANNPTEKESTDEKSSAKDEKSS